MPVLYRRQTVSQHLENKSFLVPVSVAKQMKSEGQPRSMYSTCNTSLKCFGNAFNEKQRGKCIEITLHKNKWSRSLNVEATEYSF